MHIIAFLVFGLIVGAIAKLLTPGRDPGGLIMTMVIGVIGSFIGGLIGRGLLGWGDDYAPGYILSVIGAIILLWIYRLLVRWRA